MMRLVASSVAVSAASVGLPAAQPTLFAQQSLFGSVCTPVSAIDFEAYSGRWYNVYYDPFTTLFSSPDCATAYYAINTSARTPTLTVNNSGANSDGSSTYLTGYVSQLDPSKPADLTLHLEGVSQDASYRVCALSDKTYGGKFYEWSLVRWLRTGS